MIEESLKSLVRDEVDSALTANRFKAHIDMGESTHITGLPFPPFVGLELNASGANVKIMRVFWNHVNRVFECVGERGAR